MSIKRKWWILGLVGLGALSGGVALGVSLIEFDVIDLHHSSLIDLSSGTWKTVSFQKSFQPNITGFKSIFRNSASQDGFQIDDEKEVQQIIDKLAPLTNGENLYSYQKYRGKLYDFAHARDDLLVLVRGGEQKLYNPNSLAFENQVWRDVQKPYLTNYYKEQSASSMMQRWGLELEDLKGVTRVLLFQTIMPGFTDPHFELLEVAKYGSTYMFSNTLVPSIKSLKYTPTYSEKYSLIAKKLACSQGLLDKDAIQDATDDYTISVKNG